MKHVRSISVPARAQAKQDTWVWTIGGIIAGLLVDNKWIDQK